MRRAEDADAEEDRIFGPNHRGCSLREELRRRENTLQRMRSLRKEPEREKREEQVRQGQAPVTREPSAADKGEYPWRG